MDKPYHSLQCRVFWAGPQSGSNLVKVVDLGPVVGGPIKRALIKLGGPLIILSKGFFATQDKDAL